MADTNLDAGKSFLTNVLAKLPEHLRAQAQAAFEAADASAALEEAGRGYKSLSETSRLADEAKATRERAEALYNQNRAWYEANSAEVQAAAALRAKVAALESGKPADGQPPLPDANAGPKYVRDEDFRATVAESVGLFAVTVPRLARRHEKLFGEELPIEELIAEAQKAGMTLERAYDLKFAAQLKTKADEAHAAEVARIKAEGVAEFRQAHPQMPYPSPRAQQGSPLDALPKGAPVEPGANLVSEAEALYNELVAKSEARV